MGVTVLGRILGPALAMVLFTAGCNPLYVGRAGWAQAQILASREPLAEVITDPATDQRTRGKLRLVRDARIFARDVLGFENSGRAYTTFARLPSDTLALVLTAAHRDRLELHTWWFPVVGRVPYRAYFSERGGIRARDRMEAEGYDTFLRPTAAFSTLGWFADPVYSTLLRQDEVGVVETILHELAHNHLFLSGQGRFNESYATFAGHAAAMTFFCGRDGGGADTVWCRRAEGRWNDARTVSRFLMELEADLREIYARQEWTATRRIQERDRRYRRALDEFRDQVQPHLVASRYEALSREELNNATLLARGLYFHRLDDFHSLWIHEWEGDLAGLMSWLAREASAHSDAFRLLDALRGPPGSSAGPRPEGRSTPVAPKADPLVFNRLPGGLS